MAGPFLRGCHPLTQLPYLLAICGCRYLTCSSPLLSGHSRWSKIKHDKGNEDAKKNKQRSVLAQEIALASRLYGPDLIGNAKLATVVTNAKKAGFPKASIEAAIARGQGKSLNGAALENLTIEAMIPPSVATVIECQTDSKLKTLQDIRHLVAKFGGTMTPTTYMFKRKGKVVFENVDSVGADEVLDEAIEAGAIDVDEDDDGKVIVFTDPSSTRSVEEQLSASLGFKVESSDIIWDPNEDTKVTISSEAAVEHLEVFLGRLQEEPSVQGVYLNAK
ncbi:YebC-like [Lasallia pustulata]|uniref:YebC-like n=1 Tax=Lasallia pustulata TaxID=136370 RepID=A0A1W5D6U7_9LECA|nr:YebC-like [Lasallia pustulata]